MIDFPFTEDWRADVAKRVAAFPHQEQDARDLKRAAVCIAIAESEDDSGQASFLLTRRQSSLRAHSGQWALPGGRCDAGETHVQTALRELEEEIGLKLGEGMVMGTLDAYHSRSGYAITPVIVWAGMKPRITPNPDEVAAVYRIPLAQIAAEQAAIFITIPESERPVIRLAVRDRHIHAPTAALLYQFAELLHGRVTRVDQLEQPVFAWK
ncbi:MAG: CoA pyrophosphatase [Alphaproteobacteria bacterium]|nr:CoA pyrophosphatase [Alphaproteobacteria bacterium]